MEKHIQGLLYMMIYTKMKDILILQVKVVFTGQYSSSQTIPLNENPFSDWDMISTYATIDDVETIMSPIINNFIIIKDASGLAYWPAIPVTTLDFMKLG